MISRLGSQRTHPPNLQNHRKKFLLPLARAPCATLRGLACAALRAFFRRFFLARTVKYFARPCAGLCAALRAPLNRLIFPCAHRKIPCAALHAQSLEQVFPCAHRKNTLRGLAHSLKHFSLRAPINTLIKRPCANIAPGNCLHKPCAGTFFVYIELVSTIYSIDI